MEEKKCNKEIIALFSILPILVIGIIVSGGLNRVKIRSKVPIITEEDYLIEINASKAEEKLPDYQIFDNNSSGYMAGTIKIITNENITDDEIKKIYFKERPYGMILDNYVMWLFKSEEDAKNLSSYNIAEAKMEGYNAIVTRYVEPKEVTENVSNNQYNVQENQYNYNYQEQNTEQIVYRGETGTKYHRKNCRTLKGNGIAISLSDAKAEGREPCKVCKPNF